MIYFKLFTDSKLRNKIEVLEEIKRNIRNKRVISCFKTKIEYVSTFFDYGNDRNKGSGVIMKIEGTREEIAWVKEAIKNSCSRCPFLESCNKQAKEEGANGNLKSCEEFLRHKIKYVVENE